MNDHYYTKNPASRLKITRFESRLRGHRLVLFSGSGVFSIGKVDRGTQLLTDNALIEDGWDVLDLGCGFGPVGLAVAKSCPSCRVLMTDINYRAVKLARMGLKENHIENAEVVQSDGFEKITSEFDTILLNPPQNAGKTVCESLISGSRAHLKDGGLIQVVARHNKGGKSLSAFMEDIFGNVSGEIKGSGYRIYISRNFKKSL